MEQTSLQFSLCYYTYLNLGSGFHCSAFENIALSPVLCKPNYGTAGSTVMPRLCCY